jgi:hypothetical protein
MCGGDGGVHGADAENCTGPLSSCTDCHYCLPGGRDGSGARVDREREKFVHWAAGQTQFSFDLLRGASAVDRGIRMR